MPEPGQYSVCTASVFLYRPTCYVDWLSIDAKMREENIHGHWWKIQFIDLAQNQTIYRFFSAASFHFYIIFQM